MIVNCDGCNEVARAGKAINVVGRGNGYIILCDDCGNKGRALVWKSGILRINIDGPFHLAEV